VAGVLLLSAIAFPLSFIMRAADAGSRWISFQRETERIALDQPLEKSNGRDRKRLFLFFAKRINIGF